MKQVVILIVFATFFLFNAFHVKYLYAQTADIVVETESPIGVEDSSTESAILKPERVNYELPYPGMLPDNPFYFLKVIRDGMVKLLINDEMKMARFSLLNAEKRGYSAKLLVDKNKDNLAVETLSKGNNYLNDCLTAVRKYQQSHPKSPDTKPFLIQFYASTRKLLELEQDIKASINKNQQAAFAKENQRTGGIEKVVKSMIRQK